LSTDKEGEKGPKKRKEGGRTILAAYVWRKGYVCIPAFCSIRKKGEDSEKKKKGKRRGEKKKREWRARKSMRL